jgi:hypothetical protein
MINSRLVLAVVAATLAGCGSEPTSDPNVPATVAVSPTSGSEIEALFPLVDGHIYQYLTESDEGQDKLVVRAQRSEPGHGALQMPSGTKEFYYAPDGVKLTLSSGASVYVLKMPLTVGTQWRGERGGMVEIVEVGATVSVPAGSYQDCVKTVERRGGDRPLSVSTVYCPGVGIVLLEAASGAQMERAALSSYGPPVDLGPDGVRTLREDPDATIAE